MYEQIPGMSLSLYQGRRGVLTAHPQRLDCAVMHVSIIQAGTLLARLGRPEVENCVKGLQQYSYAYEECMEQANDISRQFTQAVNGDFDLNHMASVLRPTPTQQMQDLAVGDENGMFLSVNMAKTMSGLAPVENSRVSQRGRSIPSPIFLSVST